ncbi:MAG: hypothetical protein N3G19_03095 [Candidatus Pacearchaeota archaeon]|nr:hypothetical protein [Candidatus Pacearchaeota archaeon]
MMQKELRDKIAKGWLHVHLIFEVLGKPPEHLEKALTILLERLEKEKGLEILSKQTHKPKPVEKTENVFTSFAEVESLINGFSRLIEIIFDYMPSSIEITAPVNLNFKLEDANAFVNDLATRLHQYDLLSKKLRLERDIIYKKFSEVLEKEKDKEKSANKEKSET